MHNDEFICPFACVLNKIAHLDISYSKCIGTITGTEYCSDCVIGPVIDSWYKNKLEDDKL